MSSRSGGRKRSQEGNKTIADNRKATFLYEIVDFFDAGIVLTGSEIKSVRQNKINIKASYVSPEAGEIFLINSNIPKYQNSIVENYNPKRKRKLLLNKNEINKLIGRINVEGFSLVPTKMYFKKGKAKIEIAVAKGKKQYDKRHTKKTRDWNRERARYFRKSS